MLQVAEDLAAARHFDQFACEAGRLGVSVDSLRRIGAGWFDARDLAGLGFDGAEGALAFPMRNSVGRTIGIRLRRSCGFKFAVRGSTNGLFFDESLPGRLDELVIAEGGTDTAALLDLGFNAVGRPSCANGSAHVRKLVLRLRPARVVVAADADGPGRRGACSVARELMTLVHDVRVIEPPDGWKDMRAWRLAGARREDMLALVNRTQPVGLAVTPKLGGS